eukprot:CAMPEP_0204008496 /NCGR_PEP_ID=MMETSP0360-20130528/21200_1 /ASSEMBLY_ACC=CAM_ASM_000342 /TAXON_ID=268821 /ORGANISM="Scrippsiella Hangoei, Strain SHTV-5" /LENGTH=44 /DNA_ID= /DNA_START= /DNA_END= /DNA_ORIENTATION=
MDVKQLHTLHGDTAKAECTMACTMAGSATPSSQDLRLVEVDPEE